MADATAALSVNGTVALKASVSPWYPTSVYSVEGVPVTYDDTDDFHNISGPLNSMLSQGVLGFNLAASPHLKCSWTRKPEEVEPPAVTVAPRGDESTGLN